MLCMKILKPQEVAKQLGISVKTLQKWDKEGTFKALRNHNSRRYYTQDQVDEYINRYFIQ